MMDPVLSETFSKNEKVQNLLIGYHFPAFDF